MIFYKEKFKLLRKQHRLSITALSELTEISRQSISKWENGKSSPTEKKVRLLAKILEISPSEISDIQDQHPVSRKNISQITQTLSINENRPSIIDRNIQTILSCLNKINSEQTNIEIFLRTVLQHTSCILYLKDIDQKYVLVSNSFLEALSLPAQYQVKERLDDDFFTKKEALENTLEDNQVLMSGKPVSGKERYIFGTKRTKWGNVSKVPLLDEKNRIAGVLGIITDITKQKKYENQIDAVNYAVSQLDKVIWLAKGINGSTNDPFLFRELIFTTNSTTPPKGGDKFWGNINPNDLSCKEISKIWRSAMTEKTKECFLNRKKNLKFPLSRYYNLISPITQKEIWVAEDIVYDKNNDYFIGTISFDLNLIKLNLMGEVLNEVPNIIVWIGNICNDEKSFRYQYLSNTEKITEYKTSFFLDNNKIILNLATDPSSNDTVIQNFINNDFPFSYQYEIMTESGKIRTIRSFYYKVGKDSVASATYYGFHLLIE